METKTLAEYIVGLSYTDLDDRTIEMTKLSVLDWLGVGMRGAYESPSLIASEVLKSQAPDGNATVLGKTSWKTSALFASLLNGISSHSLDMDDVHNSSQSHLGVAVIPAALAVAESIKNVSGKDFITAVVAGYEVMGRVGRSVMPEAYYYWHTTGTAGTFGAAAAAGKLMGLDVGQMVFCLGSAGTQAAGLFEFLKDGTNSKTLHAGKAAFNGVLAAQLSQKGFSAAYAILEGEKGFLNAMTKNPKPYLLIENLGEDIMMKENSFKPYACCRWCHSAINAVLDIRAAYALKLEKIHSIKIRTIDTGLDITDNINPQTVYGCKFSIQYCVATALKYGHVGVDDFTEKCMYDPDIRHLMTLCRTEGFDMKVCLAKGELPFTIITIRMEDGSEFTQQYVYPLGDPQQPMSFFDMEEKFRGLTESVCSVSQVEGALNFVQHLPFLENLTDCMAFYIK